MSNDALTERGKELEEAFFKKVNQRLTDKLKAESQKKADKESISRVTGIASEELLNRLVELKLSASSLAALALLPVVEVAWADGRIDDKEKKAALDASQQAKLSGPALEIVEAWMNERPAKEVFNTWSKYLAEIMLQMSAAERVLMRSEISGRARQVAEASGGFLGMGNKVSQEEEAVLQQIAKAFE
jgi:tellurite resistance protein